MNLDLFSFPLLHMIYRNDSPSKYTFKAEQA